MNLLWICSNITPPLKARTVNTDNLGILWFKWVHGTCSYKGIFSSFTSRLLVKTSISNAQIKMLNILPLMYWFVRLTQQNGGWRLLRKPYLRGWVKLNADDSSLCN